MGTVSNDIELLDKLTLGYDDEFLIYPRATEYLGKLMPYLDLNGKSVYTVLSSSDAYFSLLLKDCASIDTFDVNPLTKRYYYLRKWLIHEGHVYADELSFTEIYNLVSSYLDSPDIYEKSTANFWTYYLEKLKSLSYKEYSYDDIKFYQYYLFNILEISTHLDQSYIDFARKLPELEMKLKTTTFNYECIDITKPLPNNHQKYDIIYLSNILDYADKKQTVENLDKLLNDDGYIVGTSILYHPYFNLIKMQKELMSPIFKYEELFNERKYEYGADDKITYFKYTRY